jgi:hypothetical protein
MRECVLVVCRIQDAKTVCQVVPANTKLFFLYVVSVVKKCCWCEDTGMQIYTNHHYSAVAVVAKVQNLVSHLGCQNLEIITQKTILTIFSLLLHPFTHTRTLHIILTHIKTG